jgi:hypothetical protein
LEAWKRNRKNITIEGLSMFQRDMDGMEILDPGSLTMQHKLDALGMVHYYSPGEKRPCP